VNLQLLLISLVFLINFYFVVFKLLQLLVAFRYFVINFSQILLVLFQLLLFMFYLHYLWILYPDLLHLESENPLDQTWVFPLLTWRLTSLSRCRPRSHTFSFHYFSKLIPWQYLESHTPRYSITHYKTPF
jgi:hypothetical protein